MGLCGDYVWILCVEMMCGDFVWRSCVAIMSGDYVLVCVLMHMFMFITCVYRCNLWSLKFEVQAYVGFVCVGCRGLSILCVHYV